MSLTMICGAGENSIFCNHDDGGTIDLIDLSLRFVYPHVAFLAMNEWVDLLAQGRYPSGGRLMGR